MIEKIVSKGLKSLRIENGEERKAKKNQKLQDNTLAPRI